MRQTCAQRRGRRRREAAWWRVAERSAAHLLGHVDKLPPEVARLEVLVEELQRSGEASLLRHLVHDRLARQQEEHHVEAGHDDAEEEEHDPRDAGGFVVVLAFRALASPLLTLVAQDAVVRHEV